MNNPKLDELRVQINAVDDQLIKLLEKRFAIVNEVSRVKQENNLPVFDAKREQAVLERLGKQVKNPALVTSIQTIYQTIMDEAKKHE